jgi:hypothetical protein
MFSDFERVIHHHIQHDDYRAALEVLKKQVNYFVSARKSKQTKLALYCMYSSYAISKLSHIDPTTPREKETNDKL